MYFFYLFFVLFFLHFLLIIIWLLNKTHFSSGQSNKGSQSLKNNSNI